MPARNSRGDLVPQHCQAWWYCQELSTRSGGHQYVDRSDSGIMVGYHLVDIEQVFCPQDRTADVRYQVCCSLYGDQHLHSEVIDTLLTSVPDGLAGLKNPQLEFLGAASMVAAVESMIVFRSARSCTACGTTVGTKMTPVTIISLRTGDRRENIVGVFG